MINIYDALDSFDLISCSAMQQLQVDARSKKTGGMFSMKFLLNKRERNGVRFTCDKFQSRFHKSAESDTNLIVHLGDNPHTYLCWSAVSGKVPTFRTGNGKMYSPYRQQWLLPKDKLTCLGLPVTKQMALAMGVPSVPVADRLRAASISGNSFHFGSVCLVHLVALSCYQMIED